MRRALIVLAALVLLSPVPSAADSPGKAFTIADTGAATGLVPGGTVTRGVRVTNPGNQDIKVTRLAGSAGRPSPDCPANAVTVDAFVTPVLVARNSHADVPLTVRMATSAPNACKNLTFPLTYSGTAIKP
ncbi:hypothetical protein SAMN04488564_10526 [Lentzea waywayandensis]|uniref:Uncharacterized protein n=1 Tax=Lentzea waywayandensis TaxID=84724 RepID=A0A1I6EQG3_9PSEU|nr:hypothetical protein [Lentzea waywayandensis]SFR19811.1 hypothetical protein SAMN04488564_10526 [Lentzea waywayandensis]